MLEQKVDPLSLANLLRHEVWADPYPFYRVLRETDPVHWDELMGFWVLTRYDDVAFAFNDPRFSRAQGLMGGFRRLPEAEQRIAEPVYHTYAQSMPYTDPPYHTRLRGLVNKAFTPRVVERMRPYIQQVVDDLLDMVEAKGEMDVIRDLAYPLPLVVIAAMLGFPIEERQQLKKWSEKIDAFGDCHWHFTVSCDETKIEITKIFFRFYRTFIFFKSVLNKVFIHCRKFMVL